MEQAEICIFLRRVEERRQGLDYQLGLREPTGVRN